MPQLPDQGINVKAPGDGKWYQKSVPASVLSDGMFSIGIPDELVAITYRLIQLPEWRSVATGSKQAKTATRLTCAQLSHGLNLLRQAALEYMTGKETSERLIIYGAQVNVAFWIGQGGKLFPNGYAAKSKGEWWTPKMHADRLTATSNEYFYNVGLYAEAVDKVTTHRPSGASYRYVSVNNEPDDSPAMLLNSFTCLNTDYEGEGRRQMPYSDEAATFFYNLMLGMCKLAMNIDDFISDDKKLARAIADPKIKLLDAPK